MDLTPTSLGIKIIDVDTHLSEPHDLWTSRAPPRWRDRVPQVKVIDGTRSWVMDRDQVIGLGACPNSTILKDGAKSHGVEFLGFEIEQVYAGSHDLKARLAYMDAIGVAAQIVYPNVLGFGGQTAGRFDADLKLICVQIYNDAMAEMQRESRGRLCPMALLPWWDLNLSVAEVRRCHALGLHGVNINSEPYLHGLPDLGMPHWDPLWEVCQELNLPVNFHIGSSDAQMDWFGSAYWPSLNDDLKLTVGSTMVIMANYKTMANLIVSGLLDRFPKLRFVSVESGIGWIPFMLETLQYQLAENMRPSARKLSLTPMEYFQRNISACFWFERNDLAYMVQRLGADNLMFETDFPHPTCLYPNATARALEAVKGMDIGVQRQLLGGNAARVYSICLQ